MINWRPKQKETLKAAIEAIESGYSNVLIDAPVGFGKTIVNYKIAEYLNRKYGYKAFYTTPQIALIEQIERDPLIGNRVRVIKGRENYPCLADRRYTAASGKCRRDKRYKCMLQCMYKVEKVKAMMHWISVMSFAYLIYDRYVPEEYSFGRRELIIVDEADDIESWAEEFGSFRFRVSNEFKDIDDVIGWAEISLKNTKQKIAEYEAMPYLDDDDLKEYENLKKYEIKLTNFLSHVSRDKDNWVFEKKDDKLVVKPVRVGEILHDLLWSRAMIRVCSSGTIIDRAMFCKTTGLRLEDTFMIKVGSIFPVENRPVIYCPIAKMTKELRADNAEAIADAVVKIVEKHAGMRGICHAHCYEIAELIAKKVMSSEVLKKRGIRVGVHDENNRKDVFNKFLNGEIDFLISVGFNRGIDLKYDLARYQIIVRVPYPDISDIRVRELWINRKAWNWARYQAIKNIVQAYGRIVRAEDDWGITYIIDESFGHLFRYKSQMPKYFVEAVKEVSSLDEVEICPRCGRLVEKDEKMCPRCGECVRCIL